MVESYLKTEEIYLNQYITPEVANVFFIDRISHTRKNCIKSSILLYHYNYKSDHDF